MGQGRKTALNVFYGKIVHEELEHQRGGSGLCYSFDMRRGKCWREVGMNAMTGKTPENSRDGANPED